MVAALIDAGANVNLQDNYGYTALIWASFTTKTEEVITALIDAGADLNLQDNQGNTALQTAQSLGHNEIAQLLLQQRTNGYNY